MSYSDRAVSQASRELVQRPAIALHVHGDDATRPAVLADDESRIVDGTHAVKKNATPESGVFRR
ncbi:MAG: hypothetical protein H7Y89_01035 [Steroidobacteraceae bacterium]|nr:hypothetical protein [Steroidobacteraceae bacterium]